MRLLLIEDDRPIARGIQSSLEQAGFTVDMVHDGIFAEQALAQNRHELRSSTSACRASTA